MKVIKSKFLKIIYRPWDNNNSLRNTGKFEGQTKDWINYDQDSYAVTYDNESFGEVVN